MTTSIPEKITAVYDRYELTVSEARKILKVEDCESDELIRLAIDAAKEEADAYLNNPFWEVASLSFDDMTNWPGNRVVSDLETQGSETDPGTDIIYNTEAAQLSSPRLNHSVPDIWSYPRVELDRLGVIKYVELILNAPPEGVSEEKIGDWSVKYLNFVSNTDRAAFVRATFWDQFRLNVGF